MIRPRLFLKIFLSTVVLMALTGLVATWVASGSVRERVEVETREHLQAQVDTALPGAVALYYDVFAPYTPAEQLYLQSEAEIQGSQAWVRMSEQISDEPTLAALRECTELELQSSVAAKAILDALESTTV